MTKYKTDQEEFWAGDFGNRYIERNVGFSERNIGQWGRILRHCVNLQSVIEFGANKGVNLQSIQRLFPQVKATGVEINTKACACMSQLDNVEVVSESMLSFNPKKQYDLAYTRGVLIHINPSELNHVYDVLCNSSSRYICIAEYYSPQPQEMLYQGFEKRLFKRDFAGEFMNRHPNWYLIDYGFIYHRDRFWPGDDINWFLMQKVV